MIPTAIGFFSLTALLGLYLASLVLQSKETPKAVALAHGAFAVTGLILLVVYALRDGPDPVESIILFALAASGGLYMFARDLSYKPIPKWLAVGHGLLAIAGFVMLLIFAFSG